MNWDDTDELYTKLEAMTQMRRTINYLINEVKDQIVNKVITDNDNLEELLQKGRQLMYEMVEDYRPKEILDEMNLHNLDLLEMVQENVQDI